MSKKCAIFGQVLSLVFFYPNTSRALLSLEDVTKHTSTRFVTLTEVRYVVAGGVERAGVELEPHDGEDDDGEEQEQRDVDQGADRLQDGRNHNLQA